uniref:Unkown protein n=1 Tax=Riptortus pedestris TaxID=329032 RepID=R4WE20_RIPPE|nr:unkown protein [Riptortus pedestris]
MVFKWLALILFYNIIFYFKFLADVRLFLTLDMTLLNINKRSFILILQFIFLLLQQNELPQQYPAFVCLHAYKEFKQSNANKFITHNSGFIVLLHFNNLSSYRLTIVHKHVWIRFCDVIVIQQYFNMSLGGKGIN